VSIQSEQDFVALSRIGRIVGLTLREMERVLEPGMTTLELDQAGEQFLE
jgi:methionyl aminopeptidase